jgi:hypothetical protein
MDRLLNVMTGLSLALLALVFISVRREHIRVEYSASWFVAAVALLILSRSKRLLQGFSEFLGIPDAPLALIVLVVLVFALVLFRLSILISNLKDANIALAQRVAILEFQIRSLHEEQQKTAAE